jgi:site-specific DNA recombinase
MMSSKLEGIEAIAARDGISERSAHMGLSLAFLAPDIVQGAVDGTLPRGLGVSRLMDMPPSWANQWHALGIAPNLGIAQTNERKRDASAGSMSTASQR